MAGTVVMVNNPFQPAMKREVIVVESSLSIRTWLDHQGITEFSQPTLCLHNGRALLREEWPVTTIKEGDFVAFVALPAGGGGGGGGGKNPLRTVLMVAVMVAAPAIAGMSFGTGIGTMLAEVIGWGAVTSLATVGVAMAGTALVNALIPAPSPAVPSMSYGSVGGAVPAPSPTYSLQAQGNEARLGQPIPVIYGRHIIFPDLAAIPYHEYLNNDQYLFQLHCIGQGEYDIEQLRIEDTPITSFDEVTYEIVPPGGSLSLFDPDVVVAPEVAGQELLSPSDGGDWIGPFAAHPADTIAESIGIDVVLPRGLYYANDGGGLDSRSVQWTVQAREIDADGSAIGDWISLGSETHSTATTTPIRLSFRYSVPPGRYEIRLQRTDAKEENSRVGHELRWGSMRAYLQGSPDFGDVTLLAIRMRATDNLSQRSSRMINCVVTRRLPVWDSSAGWSTPSPTRSIAWAVADLLKANYGAELTDDRIDLTALHTLDQTWQSRGDHFDAVFDSGTTVWEALGKLLRCGRAVPFLQTGIVRMVRDESQSLPVAMFGPRNIVKNSLRIQYLMPSEETADAVTVSYFSNRTWKPDEITVSLPESQSEKPAKVTLFGCTDATHAEREGLYMATANRYHRRIITFQTEMEGLIPTYGDLIAISHDMPSWGQGGEVIGWDGNTLTLSEPLVWKEGAEHVIALRRRDGSVNGPWSVIPGGLDRQVIMTDTMDMESSIGVSEERTFFAFGVSESWSQFARVLSVRPRGERVEIGAVGDEDAMVAL
ncbi:MAG: phage tail protein [Magnetococcales bacterium]|nr:phage tail protein [Magnetococcales bacterium]